jgi:hypothetical protein
LNRRQFLQGEVDRMDDLLGGLGHGRVSRHGDYRLLQRAKLLKANRGVDPSGDSGPHKALNELTR